MQQLPVRLYERLAKDLEALIRSGTLPAGARAPSIRQLCRERAASPASVVRAYELLEARGLIESRPRSGFFVARILPRTVTPPRTPNRPNRPAHVDISDLVFEILQTARSRDTVPLGSA